MDRREFMTKAGLASVVLAGGSVSAIAGKPTKETDEECVRRMLKDGRSLHGFSDWNLAAVFRREVKTDTLLVCVGIKDFSRRGYFDIKDPSHKWTAWGEIFTEIGYCFDRQRQDLLEYFEKGGRIGVLSRIS